MHRWDTPRLEPHCLSCALAAGLSLFAGETPAEQPPFVQHSEPVDTQEPRPVDAPTSNRDELAKDEAPRAEDPPPIDAPTSPPDAPGETEAASIQAPRLTKFVQATYPEDAKTRRREADVVLALTVSDTGQVTRVEVLKPAGHGFDEAATHAAYQFAFRPAVRNGKPVAARILYRYSFELDAPPIAPKPHETAAPASSIRGRIALEGTDMPVVGASIEVLAADGQRHAAVSGSDGTFEVARLASGRCHLVIQSPGMSPIVRDLDAAPSRVTTVNASLHAGSDDDALEISVEGERHPATTERTVSQREMQTMPGALGDSLRGLQNLPGVAVVPMGTAELVVRGMGPRANLVFVDGLLVLNAYHQWGISAVVPTEMLEQLTFFPGNYGVEYGRGMGSMVELTTRRPSGEDGYHGLVQVDMIDSRAMLEGPVPGLHKWSFIGGVRRSHVDQTLMPLLGFDAVPIYYDYQAFFETRPSPRSRLRLGFLGSHDRLRFGNEADALQLRTRSTFFYALSRYDSQINDELSWEHTLAAGYVRNTFMFELPVGSISADAPAYPLAARTSLAWQALDELTVRVGTDLHYAPFDATLDLPDIRETDAQPTGDALSAPNVRIDAHELYFRPAAFAEATLSPIPRMRVVGGVRGDYTHDTEKLDASPRVRASYTLGQANMQTLLKAGVGLFSQPPQPEEVLPGYGSTDLRSSRAIHTSIGVEQRLWGTVDANVEGYYYRLNDLVERGAGRDGQVRYVNSGSGNTFGLETLLRYSNPEADFYGWLAYTLSRSTHRTDSQDSYTLTDYDQTHIMTALGSYRLGRGWELGARFQYASGMPYTPVVQSLFSSTVGNYVPVLGERNSRRYPTFHQLDLRVEKRWNIDAFKLTAYLDVLNVYSNRRVIDIQYNDDFSESTYYKFPLPTVPSVGLRGEF